MTPVFVGLLIVIVVIIGYTLGQSMYRAQQLTKNSHFCRKDAVLGIRSKNL